MPDKVRVGETFEIHADIFSSRAQKAKLDAQAGRGHQRPRRREATSTCKPGDNDVTFKSVVRVAGEVTYALDLSDVDEDRFKENNRCDRGRRGRRASPSVLYVEGNTARASYLARALARAAVRRRHRRPRELPSTPPRARDATTSSS